MYLHSRPSALHTSISVLRGIEMLEEAMVEAIPVPVDCR